MARTTVHFPAILLVTFGLTCGAAAQSKPAAALVPDRFELTEVARSSIDAAWRTEAERGDRRIFHGVWLQEDIESPANRARVALLAWQLDDVVFSDPTVPAWMRAEARLRAGDPGAALSLLEGDRTPAAVARRGRAYVDLGQTHDAIDALAALPALPVLLESEDADLVVHALRGHVLRAELTGQAAHTYQQIMDVLGHVHQDLDRLDWRAMVIEGKLLASKTSRQSAAEALHAALGLNPRATEAWHALGQLALSAFDFDGAERAADAMDRIVLTRQNHLHHPLATLLRARSRLVQDDPEQSIEYLNAVLAVHPEQRDALELMCAAASLTYDPQRRELAFARMEQVAPGSPRAYFVTGRFLSIFRQYGDAQMALDEATARLPAWTAPRLESGLMAMQSGHRHRAQKILAEVVEIDPFNKRAGNSLLLLEQMLEYDRIETEHFVISYAPGIDAVFAELMPEAMEELHRAVSERYELVPSVRTQIEVFPDHERFGVRITGMPSIHTIAACTGPVIAMEVPREGKKSEHFGTFDWVRVIRHEYTHTVTLEQTGNRIPHWLTEAAAVGMELAPRKYSTCLMLARSLEAGTLFTLDEIKWGFVRPKKSGDRGKAYAQAHWMLEFMDVRYGHDAVIALLAAYKAGQRETQAIESALGVGRDAFFAGFLEWAADEVVAWGLHATPSLTMLTDELRENDPDLMIKMAISKKARLDAIARAIKAGIGQARRPGVEPLRGRDWPTLVRPPVTVSRPQLREWRQKHPDHPDLVEMSAHYALDDGVAPADLIGEFEKYIALRPVDPWPHRQLARHWLASDTPERAIDHLEALDIREEDSPVYAWRLSQLYRDAGDIDRAHLKITRAVMMNAYHAGYRELAAAVAIQAKSLRDAHRHIRALTLLEPDRAIHQRRLERIEQMQQEADRGAIRRE